MLLRLLPLLLTLACAQIEGQALSSAISVESIQPELEPAEGRPADLSPQTLFPSVGSPLQKTDGAPTQAGQTAFDAAGSAATNPSAQAQPLISAEHIVSPREQKTISANVTISDFTQPEKLSRERQTLARMEAEIDAENNSQHNVRHQQRLQSIALVSTIEFLLTLIALNIAFQLGGLSHNQGSLLIISLSVGLVSALLGTLMPTGPLHPIKVAAGFAVLLVLIRSITPVKKWTTAFKIAAAVRLAASLCLWLGYQGLSGLLRI